MPTDRKRALLIGVGCATIALAALSLRAIKSAVEVGTRPIPVTDLQSLAPFLGPLSDTSVLDHVSSGTMVVTRDPFGASLEVAPRVPVGTAVEYSRPTTSVRQYWVVSSILFEGTRRSAIVNNAWVSVGDALGGGSRLTAVERDHIVVTDARGVRHVVPIQGGES